VTPEDFERVRELFLAARELDATKRPEYLDQACANSAHLRAEVEALLAQEGGANGLIDVPTRFGGLRSGIERVLQTMEPEPIPDRIGRYSILAKLGGGGMGIVYLAEQEHPRRKVALKVLRPGGMSRLLLRRFEHEASILGQLDHPGIAQIHEAGVADVQTDSGLTAKWPFFAMEYVQGEPLGEYIRRRKPSTPQRLTLLASICDAVHHAHQKGVIHRDLKPGNILVDQYGRPKILDFGIARLTNTDVQTVTMQTEVGQLIGTIPYMSPEQVTGVSGNIDTRSDVYALGVICYELLTGRLPYAVHDCSIPEAARIIREEEPTRISSVDTLFRGDLDAIVGKALEKDKTRRYQSASELAADLRNHLENRPIAARPPTTFYQLRMFARRNRTLVGGVLATLLALLVGVIGITTQAVRATRERDRAQHAELLANERREQAEFRAYVAHVAAAQAALRANDVATARRRLEAAPVRLRNWEWRYLENRLDGSLARLTAHGHHAWCVAYAPDGSWLASGSADETVKLWDLANERVLRTMSAGARVRAVAVSPNGRRVVAAAENGLLLVWDSLTGDELMTLPGHTGDVTGAAISSDGALIASGSFDNTARVWDADTGELLTVLEHPNWVYAVCFTPDSARLATSCRDNVARLWDLATGKPVVEVEVLPPTADWDYVHSWAVAIDPAGQILATGGHDGVIKLWSASNGSLLKVLTGHTERVRALAFSPDGAQLASASDDSTVRLWSPAAGTELVTLLGHEDSAFGVAFSPDGARLASAARDRTIRIWDARATWRVARMWGHENGAILDFDISPDGTRIISVGEDHVVRLWDARSGAGLLAMRGHEDSVHAVDFSSDGTQAVSCSGDGTLRLWDGTSGEEVGTMAGHEGAVQDVAFLQNDGRVASAGSDGTIRIWDLAARSELVTMGSETEQYTALACSPDGRRLASGSSTGRIEFWDVQTARRLRTAEGHEGRIYKLAYSPDGMWLVSASGDRTLKLWSAGTGELVTTLRGHTDYVSAAAFSPDGTRIASVSYDRTLRLWDPATGETVLSFGAHQDWPYAVAFSPDGTWLASSGKSIRLWEAATPSREIMVQRFARVAAEELIGQLFADGKDAAEIGDLVGSNETIDDDVRQYALQIARFQARRPDDDSE
jgi:WD40 repeat protein/predicted Ser/Thr protein kinase